MQKIKRITAKLIWKIAGISPDMGNLVMDILGYERYLRVMQYQK